MNRKASLIAGVLLLVLIAGLFAVPGSGIQAQGEGDHRVNCQEASPIVIYCSEGGIEIYSTAGVFLLRVTDTEIEAVGVPDVNTMLGQTAGGGVRVYRLSTGEFQVNTVNGDQEFVAIWKGCETASADLKAYSTATWELLSDDDGCPVLPDLIVASIAYIGVPASTGRSVLLNGFNTAVVVTNQGAADSGPFQTSLNCSGQVFNLGVVSNLAPGESHTFMTRACQLMTVTVDSEGQVAESNEGNNTRTRLENL